MKTHIDPLTYTGNQEYPTTILYHEETKEPKEVAYFPWFTEKQAKKIERILSNPLKYMKMHEITSVTSRVLSLLQIAIFLYMGYLIFTRQYSDPVRHLFIIENTAAIIASFINTGIHRYADEVIDRMSLMEMVTDGRKERKSHTSPTYYEQCPSGKALHLSKNVNGKTIRDVIPIVDMDIDKEEPLILIRPNRKGLPEMLVCSKEQFFKDIAEESQEA